MRLDDFERKDSGDESAGDQQAGQFALAIGRSPPYDSAAQHGDEAGDEKDAEDPQAGEELFSQAVELDHRAEQDEEEAADQEGEFGVEGVDLVAFACGEDLEAELLHGIFGIEQAGQGCAEDHDSEQRASADGVGDGVDDQDDAEGEYLPELLVGDAGEQTDPEESGDDGDDEGQNELEDEHGEDAAEDGSAAPVGRDAAIAGEAEEDADADGSEAVAEGGFDDEGGLEVVAKVELVEGGEDDRAAHAGERCGDEQRRHLLHAEGVDAEVGDAAEGKGVAEDGQRHASAELF